MKNEKKFGLPANRDLRMIPREGSYEREEQGDAQGESRCGSVSLRRSILFVEVAKQLFRGQLFHDGVFPRGPAVKIDLFTVQAAKWKQGRLSVDFRRKIFIADGAGETSNHGISGKL